VETKNILSTTSKILYVLAALILIISFFTRGFVLWGFAFLMIAGTSGLITEIFRERRIILMVGHIIAILISMFALLSVVALVVFVS